MRRLITIAVLLAATPLCVPSRAQGQARTFSFSGLLGVGGSIDEDAAGLDNLSWQLAFSNNIEERTHFGIRVGGIGWGTEDRVGSLSDPGLLYATLAGEYREAGGSFSGSFIESGIYLGLGLYRLDGTRPDGRDDDETSVGLVVGVTGDFPLNERRSLALRIELSGHYAALDQAQVFGLGQVGLSYRF